MADDEVLHGGVANAGGVVRVGDHVLRPSNPQTEDALGSIARLLRQVHDVSTTVPFELDGTWSSEMADPLRGEVFCHHYGRLDGLEWIGRRARAQSLALAGVDGAHGRRNGPPLIGPIDDEGARAVLDDTGEA